MSRRRGKKKTEDTGKGSSQTKKNTVRRRGHPQAL